MPGVADFATPYSGTEGQPALPPEAEDRLKKFLAAKGRAPGFGPNASGVGVDPKFPAPNPQGLSAPATTAAPSVQANPQLLQTLINGPNQTVTPFTPGGGGFTSGPSATTSLQGGAPVESTWTPGGYRFDEAGKNPYSLSATTPAGGLSSPEHQLAVLHQLMTTPQGSELGPGSPGFEGRMAMGQEYGKAMDRQMQLEAAKMQAKAHAGDIMAGKQQALLPAAYEATKDLPIERRPAAIQQFLKDNLGSEVGAIEELGGTTHLGGGGPPAGAGTTTGGPNAPPSSNAPETPGQKSLREADVLKKLLQSSDPNKALSVDDFLANVEKNWPTLSANPGLLQSIMPQISRATVGAPKLKQDVGYKLRSLSQKYGAPEGFAFENKAPNWLTGGDPGASTGNLAGFTGPGLSLSAPNFLGKGFEWTHPATRRFFTRGGTEQLEQAEMQRLAEVVKALQGL